jgi:hypothetical protein
VGRERRRGLQVPSGVIEASANIVGEDGERLSDRYPLSRVWCLVSRFPAARGITFLL